jgi:hypothetical protein
VEPTKAQLIKARLVAFKTTVAAVPDSAKKERISTELAKNFNGLVEMVAADYPTVKDHLPKPIKSMSEFRKVYKADESYLDLQVYVEQVISILELLDSGR